MNEINKPYKFSVPSNDIADTILDCVDDYYKFLILNGRMDIYRRSWATYYRSRISGGKVNGVGQQGELSALSVNHYRNLLLHLETMTLQQKIAFEPRATNSDVKSQSQVILATGLLDYYQREKKMERYIKSAVKSGLIFSEGFVRVEWDATAGKTYGKSPSGAIIYEGDIKFSNYNPMDVIRDFTNISRGNGQDSWYILRDFQNKYDLASKYSNLSKEILSDSADMLELVDTTTLNALSLEDSDQIPVYTLLHKPTPALPQGRYTVVLGNNTVLADGPIPYEETHVYRIAPDEEEGTIFGYSVGFDLLPIQESLDILYSTALTNQATFGVQNVLAPQGFDLSVEQISGGLNLLTYDPKLGKPEALQLTQTPVEVFNFMNILEKLAETISGVNSVARGNPEASLKSGAALALVQSMAIQFTMNLQQSYCQLVEDLGSGVIKILQRYAQVPRIKDIAGKANRPLMKEFSGADLDQISRVIVDLGNPLSRTTAGKVNLADSLIEKGLIDNADQYLQVVSTGRLEPIIEGKQAQLLLIKGENEFLSEGKIVRALLTDNHQKHILEHTTVLSNPEIRTDANNPIVINTLNHIQEHLDLMNDPNVQRISNILHQEVIPSVIPSNIGGMMDNTLPVVQEANNINPPNMPTNPLTGEQ